MSDVTADAPAAAEAASSAGGVTLDVRSAGPPTPRATATRAVLLAAGLVAGGILFNELVTLVAAGLVTVILAIALSGIAGPLERRGLARPLGAAIAVLALLAVVGGLLALIVPATISQLQDFTDRVPEIVDRLARDIGGIVGAEPGKAGRQAQESLQRAIDSPVEMLGPIASLGLGALGVIGAAFVILLTAFYMAAQPQPLIAGLLRMFPPERREWASCVLERLRVAWTGWMRGVAVDMAVTFVLLLIGLSLIGLEFAVLFAALSALLVVVPYFGAIAGGVPPLLFALADSPKAAVLTLVVYIAVQQIEGNVIVPLIMSRAVKLHPALIAIGVVVVSQLFGIVGLLVAVPIVSAATIFVDELWTKPMERRHGVPIPAETPLADTSWRDRLRSRA
jgi:predicted PurR-regulated permease PerM